MVPAKRAAVAPVHETTATWQTSRKISNSVCVVEEVLSQVRHIFNRCTGKRADAATGRGGTRTVPADKYMMNSMNAQWGNSFAFASATSFPRRSCEWSLRPHARRISTVMVTFSSPAAPALPRVPPPPPLLPLAKASLLGPTASRSLAGCCPGGGGWWSEYNFTRRMTVPALKRLYFSQQFSTRSYPWRPSDLDSPYLACTRGSPAG